MLLKDYLKENKNVIKIGVAYMPSSEKGLIAAAIDFIIGYMVAFIANAFIDSNTDVGKLIGSLLKLMVIISSIELLERMNHWSVVYLFGYLVGYLFMGRLFSFDFFDWFIVAIGFAYTLRKMIKKRWK